MKLPQPKKLPSGKWNVQVMVDGKRVSITAKSEKEAIAQAAAAKAGMIEQNEKMSAPRITLNDALTKYIEDRSNVLSPSTVRSYKETQKNRIQELLNKRVRDITESDIQIQINIEAKAGHAAKTIKNDISLACTIIEQYKPLNRKKFKYPQRIKHEHVYLEVDQIVKLLSACEGDRAEIPILLALWLGLRRSEILGLCWDSVDFENGTLRISRALVRNDEGKFILKDYAKNESSQRTVSLPGYIADKLKAYCPEDKREGRIFKTNNSSFIYDHIQSICKREGIPFPGVHGLRHTNASVMLSLGIIDKIAMSRGGWSTDYTMKNVYQHLFQADKASADKQINEFFSSKLQMNLQTKNQDT